MSLLYHVNMYLEFLILACTIYILAPYGANTNSLIVKKTEIIEGLFSKKEVEVGYFINPNYYICPNCGLVLPVISKADLEILFKQENTDE